MYLKCVRNALLCSHSVPRFHFDCIFKFPIRQKLPDFGLRPWMVTFKRREGRKKEKLLSLLQRKLKHIFPQRKWRALEHFHFHFFPSFYRTECFISGVKSCWIHTVKWKDFSFFIHFTYRTQYSLSVMLCFAKEEAYFHFHVSCMYITCKNECEKKHTGW